MKNYFVKELDEKKAIGTRAMVGKFVTASRFIIKVGYQFDHENIHRDEYDAEYKEMLFDYLKKLNVEIESFSEYKKQEVFERFYSVFQKPRYRAAGIITARKRKEAGSDALWRRFWFSDFSDMYPYEEKQVFEIIDTKRVLTGKWYSASSSRSWTDYGYEYDYEPGGLYPCYHHTIYIARSFTKTFSGFQRYHEDALLHPDDITFFEPDMPIIRG
jgi:hypothetical protein